MKQYQYIDVKEPATYQNVGLQTTIDGVTIESAIIGYQTLSIEGRGLVSRDIQTRDYQSLRAGGKTQSSRRKNGNLPQNKMLGSRLSSRTLRIKFELQAPTDEQFRRRWERLNALVNVAEGQFIFSDDPDFYYIGTLSEAEEVEETTNHVFSSFSVECVDPYKYSNKIFQWRFAAKGTFGGDFIYPAVLEKAEITAGASGSSLVLTNKTQGLRLQIDGAFTSGSKVEINFSNLQIYDGAGANLMPALHLLSDFEGFSMSSGDTIEANLQSDVTLYYREKRL